MNRYKLHKKPKKRRYPPLDANSLMAINKSMDDFKLQMHIFLEKCFGMNGKSGFSSQVHLSDSVLINCGRYWHGHYREILRNMFFSYNSDMWRLDEKDLIKLFQKFAEDHKRERRRNSR